MAKYEYKVIEAGFGESLDMPLAEQFEKDLNAYGAQGWKVFGTGGAGGLNSRGSLYTMCAILMREL